MNFRGMKSDFREREKVQVSLPSNGREAMFCDNFHLNGSGQ